MVDNNFNYKSIIDLVDHGEIANIETISEQELVINCWDGRRYQIKQLPDGCKYSTETGEPLVEKELSL